MSHDLPYVLPTVLPGPDETYTVQASETGGDGAGSLRAYYDHCRAALALMISEYHESPNLQALLCSYLDRIQENEIGIAAVYEHVLSFDTAQGRQLDLLGRIVREARDGRPDEVYRRSLRVRVLINRSQGRLEDLIQVASLFEDGASVIVTEYAPARVTVEVDAPAVNTPWSLHVRLRRAKAAGVALQTITHPGGTEGRFFELGDGAASVDTTNTTTGLGWVGDDRGGDLAHVLG